MGQNEKNWNIALRKAAHKNAMQHVQQPLANKDGVKEVEETFISGAVCAKYILANKLGGAELKLHKEKCINEYLSAFDYIDEALKEVVMLQFNDGYHWHLLYRQDCLNETIKIVSE